MYNLRKGATALVAAAALGAGGVTLATQATAAKPAPCAIQQTNLNKAEAKLASLTAKFAAQSAKVKKDRRLVAATKGSAKAQAKKALAAARTKQAKIAKAKKAQVRRVAHDTTLLDNCLAAQTPAPSPTAGA